MRMGQLKITFEITVKQQEELEQLLIDTVYQPVARDKERDLNILIDILNTVEGWGEDIRDGISTY